MNKITREVLEEILSMDSNIEAVALSGELEDSNSEIVIFTNEKVNPMDCYTVVSTCIEDRFSDSSIDGEICNILMRSVSDFYLPEFAKEC